MRSRIVGVKQAVVGARDQGPDVSDVYSAVATGAGSSSIRRREPGAPGVGSVPDLRYHLACMTDRPEKEPRPPQSSEEATPQALAPMDFATFILSLASSALVNLGRLPPPDGTAPPRPDLPAAKQIIDILGILEEKTRGNLDDSEDKLLKSLLYDLRVQYVDAQRT